MWAYDHRGWRGHLLARNYRGMASDSAGYRSLM
jgi:hypothetical protein